MTITKLVFCVRKRPELSDEEFQTYWLERHGPLVRSNPLNRGHLDVNISPSARPARPPTPAPVIRSAPTTRAGYSSRRTPASASAVVA